jgi:hypothetical protein
MPQIKGVGLWYLALILSVLACVLPSFHPYVLLLCFHEFLPWSSLGVDVKPTDNLYIPSSLSQGLVDVHVIQFHPIRAVYFGIIRTESPISLLHLLSWLNGSLIFLISRFARASVKQNSAEDSGDKEMRIMKS